MFASVILGIVIGVSQPKVTFDYAPFRGLQVMIDDVVVIEGSGFQYYEAGWKRGYFSSAWKPIQVFKGGDGSTTVISNSDDGTVANRQKFTPTAEGFKVASEFRWRGEKPVMLEYAVGRLWAPYVAHGKLGVDGRTISDLTRPARSGSSFEQRLFGSGRSVVFDAPAGRLSIESDRPLNVMDSRNYSVEWADGKELFWLGFTDQEIRPQGTIAFNYEVKIYGTTLPIKSQEILPVTSEVLAGAQSVDSRALPLIPRPRELARTGGSISIMGGLDFTLPPELEPEREWLDEYIESKWAWERGGTRVSVRVSISPAATKQNGYTMTVSEGGVVIVGQSLEGARYGLRTLGQLVGVNGEKLVIPKVTIADWPATQWRGVHLFVGPSAVEFQGRLIDRVLMPLKFNKVVLQCERTAWASTPGIGTAITMKKGDLKDLVSDYKDSGFEVIPLVQSMGHMEWLFANKQNLDVAVNPAIPYTLDLRKAAARTTLSGIWDEVAEVVKPTTVHFGLDEIDNRGIDDEALTSRLLANGLPYLRDIAKKQKTSPMVWSDMFLAPGEAIDATHAPSKAEASARRKMLGYGTYVADWHYRDDPNPDKFDSSLKLWTSAGMKPIASTWFRPGNIRGFTLSAIRNNAGVLQTTWAGYESNEPNMIREFKQFSAFVLMADYAWSGRTELPEKLGYDPGAQFQRMYFGGQQPVVSRDGISMTGPRKGEIDKIGNYKFQMMGPVQLYGVTRFESYSSPHRLIVPIGLPATKIVLALDCLSTINEVALAGQVRVMYEDGTQVSHDLRYGAHVRSESDSRATIAVAREGTRSAFEVQTNGKGVKSVEIVALHSAAGLRLHAVTVL